MIASKHMASSPASHRDIDFFLIFMKMRIYAINLRNKRCWRFSAPFSGNGIEDCSRERRVESREKRLGGRQ